MAVTARSMKPCCRREINGFGQLFAHDPPIGDET
jgi:hypothetical protein